MQTQIEAHHEILLPENTTSQTSTIPIDQQNDITLEQVFIRDTQNKGRKNFWTINYPNDRDFGLNMLAAERTMLSWYRTGIAAISLAILIITIIPNSTFSPLLLALTSTMIIVAGIFCMMWSGIRYTTLTLAFPRKLFIMDKFTPILAITVGITITILGVLIIWL